MDKTLKTMVAAAEEGGKVLLKYFGQELELQEKSKAADVCSQADIESEQRIMQVLTQEFPQYSYHGEESGEQNNGSEFQFVIDPLDGTNNFALGIANFTISIALFHKDEVVCAVVHMPLLGQTYTAMKGQGAFCNGKKLQVNQVDDIKRSSVVYACSYENSKAFRLHLLANLYDKGIKRVLDNWSPAYDFCLLAAGKIEGIICNKIELYDFVAGQLIAIEAGAKKTSYEGVVLKPDREDTFVISNGTSLHEEFLSYI